MVRPTRFERATYRVGVCHSIQLSYERISNSLMIIAKFLWLVKRKNDLISQGAGFSRALRHFAFYRALT